MNLKGIKISFRILFKYRLYTGISLFGLGIAIASFWFIANYVKDSHQYDAFHEKSDRIYRLSMEVTAGGSTDHYATTGKPPGYILNNNYSGVTAYAKMTFNGNSVVKIQNEVFSEEGFFDVNPETLDVFTFIFLSGNRNTCFSNPKSIVLSRSLAEKYFNSLDVTDKSITINKIDYLVTGVFEDWPENSHLDVRAIMYSSVENSNYKAQDWFDLEQYNFILLDPSNSQQDLNRTLEQLNVKFLAPILEDSGIEAKFKSQPLNKLYFLPGLIDDVSKGNQNYINGLTIAGILVLLIAGFNYINLSLTQSTKRSKEIQLKKILGISRLQLLLQNIFESATMTLLALLISGILIFAFNSLYFQYTGFQAINITGNWMLILIIITITFVFGILGTSYSGIYLSFSNALINKDKTSNTRFKKVLLGFQFVIASVILIAAMAMYKQINFMKNKDLGFSKEQIIMVQLPAEEELKNKIVQFRNEVKNFSMIENASLVGGGALPGEENAKDIFQVMIEGNKAERVYNIYRIDEHYYDLLNIKMASGRNFEVSRLSDKNDAVIINEAMARSLNWDNPIGKTIWYAEHPRKVIGVTRNFHNKSLHNLIEPIVFMYDDGYASKLLVKTNNLDMNTIKSIWGKFFPDIPFEINYFDQFINAMYVKEDHLAKLLGVFSAISLVLCGMGLYAIFSLHTYQRTREISIRKVLGASSANLLKSLAGSYITITIVAFGMAIPIAWLLMKKWLEGFSYKIQLDPLLFILSASLILLLCCLAIMYHVIRAINLNPVDSLKYE